MEIQSQKDAWEAYLGIISLDDIDDAWWGKQIKWQELLAMLLFQEFDGNVNDPRVLEMMTRRYYQFCTNGPWSTSCLNGFWGYFQAVRSPLIDKYRDMDPAQINIYLGYAFLIINPKPEHNNWKQGKNDTRPFATGYVNSFDNSKTYENVKNASIVLSREKIYRTIDGENVEGEKLGLILTPNEQIKLCGGSLCQVFTLP